MPTSPPPRRASIRRALALYLSAAVALAALSVEAPALGQKAPPAEAKKVTVTAVELRLPITRLTLDNGLRVVLNVDPTSPTVAIAVVYDVGSRDEEKGRSGFAHLFEHMMFQGSKNVKRGQHTALVSGHGGTLNGTTSADRTSYFEVLPSSELALGLWLEADRMASLDIGQESFENQRRVVKEEHRARISNAAYAPSALRLEELVFEGYWPYGHPPIGSMADLDTAQLDWVRDFHARHYGPNNAVLAIAGDVDAAEATALVHRYFDKIPRIQATPFTDSALTEQTSPRTAVMKDEHARSAAVLYGWRAPALRQPGAYALDLAAIVLGGGESSRLHQILVRDKAVAQDVSARFSGRRGPSVFEIDAKLTPEAKVGDVAKRIDAVVKDFAAAGPTAEEMAKAQRRAQARLVFGLQTNGARARALAEYELFFGDAGLLAGEAARYLAVSAADVKKAADEHLAVTKRTVVETYPLEEPEAEKKPASAPKAAAAAPKAAGAKHGAAGKKVAGGPKKAGEAKKAGADSHKKKAGADSTKGGADKKKAADEKLRKKKGSP